MEGNICRINIGQAITEEITNAILSSGLSDSAITESVYKDIGLAVKMIQAHPYGTVNLYPIRESYNKCCKVKNICISWYTFRNKKQALITSYGTALVEKPAPKAEFINSKEKAWRMLYPDRCKRYDVLKKYHQLKLQGFILPSIEEIDSIRVVDIQANMALLSVETDGVYVYFLCSPISYIRLYGAREIDIPDENANVFTAAKFAGIKLPHFKKDRVWESIEPYWIMAALSK